MILTYFWATINISFMKNFFVFLPLALVILISCNNIQRNNTEKSKSKEPVYDSLLALKLGADEYGMKQYVMAYLKRGPNRDQDSATAVQLQRAHLDNINRMAREGTLVLAGPFLDAGDIRGIYIFDVKTVEEARALTATDPAIQAGRLEMELHPWYGSAALLLVSEISQSIARKEI
jgi:uncharacterized protein YciI